MKHIMLDLYFCNPKILDSEAALEVILYRAARDSGATPLTRTFYKFEPQGVTGVVLLAESHISIHTWPEKGFAAVDIFTCSDTMDAERAAQDICDALESKNRIYQYAERNVHDTNTGSRDLASL